MALKHSENRVRRPRTRWYESLYARVIVLCGVLLFCLLASVAVITNYYFTGAVEELQARTTDIVQGIELKFEEGEGADYNQIASDMMERNKGFDIHIEDLAGEAGPPKYKHERQSNGAESWTAEVPALIEGRKILVTASVHVAPTEHIVRAFKNRYILTLTCVFVATLALMVVVIRRSLHPLTRLAETCSAISSGELRTVNTHGATGEITALEDTFNDMVGALREKEMVEAKLRQAQRVSALGNLAAGIAHDVRNPLNAIKLLSSHALDAIAGGPDAPAARSLRTIRDEVDRLEEIVSSFLSLAKESELIPEPVRVDALLGECLHLIKKDAEEREVRLSGDLRAGETTLMLDAKQWTRAILNVLINALEATPPGGRVRLFSRSDLKTCDIEIRDDGPGMSREAIERAFEPYYTTKAGGTGLGLSITRGIVEEHGGTIDITSSNGAGCQVLIRLPIAKPAAPAKPGLENALKTISSDCPTSHRQSK